MTRAAQVRQGDIARAVRVFMALGLTPRVRLHAGEAVVEVDTGAPDAAKSPGAASWDDLIDGDPLALRPTGH